MILIPYFFPLATTHHMISLLSFLIDLLTHCLLMDSNVNCHSSKMVETKMRAKKVSDLKLETKIEIEAMDNLQNL